MEQSDECGSFRPRLNLKRLREGESPGSPKHAPMEIGMTLGNASGFRGTQGNMARHNMNVHVFIDKAT